MTASEPKPSQPLRLPHPWTDYSALANLPLLMLNLQLLLRCQRLLQRQLLLLVLLMRSSAQLRVGREALR
jgi:hypothetical protein